MVWSSSTISTDRTRVRATDDTLGTCGDHGQSSPGAKCSSAASCITSIENPGSYAALRSTVCTRLPRSSAPCLRDERRAQLLLQQRMLVEVREHLVATLAQALAR